MINWTDIGAEYLLRPLYESNLDKREQEILFKWEIRRQIVHKKRLTVTKIAIENLPLVYDEELERVLLTEPIYKTNRKIAMFLLQQIEKKYNPRHNTEGMTIEHIMPQTLNGYWLGIGIEEHEKHKHLLGNLTLTDYNSNLSNKSFSEKKELLKKEHLYLNDRFMELQTWNISSIESRNRMMVKEVMEYLDIPATGNEIQSEYRLSEIRDIPYEKPPLCIIEGEEIRAKSWCELYYLVFEHIIAYRPTGYMTIQSEYPKYFAKFNEEGRTLSTGDKLKVSMSKKDILRRMHNMVSLSGIDDKDFIMR